MLQLKGLTPNGLLPIGALGGGKDSLKSGAYFSLLMLSHSHVQISYYIIIILYTCPESHVTFGNFDS